MQRAKRLSVAYGSFRGFGVCQGPVCNGHDGVHFWIDCLNAIKVRHHHFHGRNFASADQFGQLCCVGIYQFGLHRLSPYLPLGRYTR